MPCITDAFTYIVFVDFENVPTIELELIEQEPVHITLLVGKNQNRIDFGLVQQVHRLAAQVGLVRVAGSGRNALDLTLAYYLGRSVQRAPDAHFAIVSKDKDFGPMIAHLQIHGVKIDRYDSFASLPFFKRPNGVPVQESVVEDGVALISRKVPLDRRAKVIARLKDPANRNSPSTRKALLAHLKAALGKHGSVDEANAVVAELMEEKVLTFGPKGEVRYNT